MLRTVRSSLKRALRPVLGVALLLVVLPVFEHAEGQTAPRFVRAIGSPAGLGSLNSPMGVTYAPGEDPLLYVVDSGNARIQAFRPSGEVVGMWGKRGRGLGEFWQPTDIAATVDGRFVYVVDRRHRVVMKFAPTRRCLEQERSCFVRSWGGRGFGPGLFQEPMGIAVDRSGQVYVADWGAHQVQVFDRDGSYVRTIGKPGKGKGELFRPSDVAIAPDGKVWVADRDNDRIAIFEQDGTEAGMFKAASLLHYPTGIEFNAAGDFAIMDHEKGFETTRIRIYSVDRKLIHEQSLGGNGRAHAHGFQGVAMLPDGRAVVTLPDEPEYGLVAIGRSGTRQDMAPRGHELQQLDKPRGVAVDPYLMAVVDAGNKRVLLLDPNDNDRVIAVLDQVSGYDFSRPRGVAILRTGDEPEDAFVFITDVGHNRVFRATAGGQQLPPWGGQLSNPFDVAATDDGEVLVVDSGNDRVLRFWMDGLPKGAIGGEAAELLRKPIAATMGPGGLVYVIEQTNPRITAFDEHGQLVAEWACSRQLTGVPGDVWRPVDLSSDGQYLYVLENDATADGTSEHVRVQVFEPKPGVPLRETLVTVFASEQGAGNGQLWNPLGIAASPDGAIVIADSGNNRVQVFHWRPETVPTPEPTATRTPLPTPTATPTEPPPTAVSTEGPRASATPEEPVEPTSTVAATDLPPLQPTEAPTVSTPSGDRQPTPGSRPQGIFFPIAVR